MSTPATRAILLMNLGSPDSTRVSDVRKYLNEFLMDERVIDVPYLQRLLLVKGIIAPFRAPRSAKAYKAIWTKDGSPLITLTNLLQQSLSSIIPEPVEIAMRYGHPSPEYAFNKLLKEHPGLKEVILFPLYPHYAMSSYETAVEYAKKIHSKNKYPFSLEVVEPYYNDEDYLEALTTSIRPYLQQEYDLLLFSYHGIPERHILKSDITHHHCLQSADCCEVASPAHAHCYRHQCRFTSRQVAERLGVPSEKWSQSFQSRLGRDEWLKPYTALRLTEMPNEGIKKLVIVCPAFVSDCLETLEEIAIEGRESFMAAGGESFTLIPCLNIHPLWLKAVEKLVSKEGEKQ